MQTITSLPLRKPKELESVSELAAHIGLPAYYLVRLEAGSDKSYKVFRLAKKSGKGFRTIAAPSMALKGIQQWILRAVLLTERVSDNSTGFAPGCSIMKNAAPHIQQDFVFNCDISDFFDTITQHRVFRLFRRLGYKVPIANALSRLTTFKGRLPQGAPTSPLLANLCAYRLDKRLNGFALKREWTYTRYADDITVSGHGNFSKRELDTIYRIIKEEGFSPNKAKERVARRGSAQLVTGLTVNEKVSVTRSKRKRIRAIFYQASSRPKEFFSRIAELQGYLAFLRQIEPNRPEYTLYQKSLQTVIEAANSTT